MWKELLIRQIKLLKSNQNTCNSFEALEPQFNDDLCFLIIRASLTNSLLQLSLFINPLTQNSYYLKDSYDVTIGMNRIVLQVCENDGYMFVLIHVISLFTNAPLKETFNIVFRNIYSKKSNCITIKTFIKEDHFR